MTLNFSEADFKEKTFNFKKNAQNGTLSLAELSQKVLLVREALKGL